MWCHCWGRGAAQRRYFYQTYHHLQWVVPETGPYQPCFYEKSLFICALFNSTDAMPCCQIIFFFIFLILLFSSKLFGLGSFLLIYCYRLFAFSQFIDSNPLSCWKNTQKTNKMLQNAKWKTNKHTLNKNTVVTVKWSDSMSSFIQKLSICRWYTERL